MRRITEVTRRELFNIIQEGFCEEVETQEYNYYYDQVIPSFETVRVHMPFCGTLTTIGFLDRLYNLDELPSTDHRYKNARGDIHCHTVSFDDWPEFWFLDDNRFQLKEGYDDEPLLKFLCEMLHPAVRDEDCPWRKYLDRFNELLHRDGYELYAAYRISGKDLYKAREYIESNDTLSTGDLFSERYKEMFQSAEDADMQVSFETKKRLSKVMLDFVEPMRVQRSRYSSWTDNTDALSEAINRFNDFIGFPLISLDAYNVINSSKENVLANQAIPHLFDVIELQFDELSKGEKSSFQSEINAVFKKDNTPFQLTDAGLIELLSEHEVLSSDIIKNIENVSEPGIRELLNDAIAKHMQPSFQAHRDAVEKIWDAFERLKTYYADLGKKASTEKIVRVMSGEQAEFMKMFEAEFIALREIGNGFRIRHHETDKVDIQDIRHYDYFFNRCLALISTAILYLE